MSSLAAVPPVELEETETDDEQPVNPTGPDPEDVVVEPKPTPPMMVPLPGDWDSIGTEFGGREPDTSEIRLLGGKMPIEGSFAKGTELDLVVRVKVTGVLGQDFTDDFGTVQRTSRRHMARMISVKRAS